MARENAQTEAWRLARRQHWVVTRRQLLALGFGPRQVDLRVEDGRLHPIHAGIYAVGRPNLTRDGHFIAAVLACGAGAALGDTSAGAHWEFLPRSAGPIHVTVADGHPRRPGITVHRRRSFEVTRHRGIPVTTVPCTIADLAADLSDDRLERAINEAVNRDLTDPERLRDAVADMNGRPGSGRVLRLLDRDTYVVTDSRLEQRFLKIARRAGLAAPATQRRLEGGRVDFFWPQLGLIVEADSLRYHRTPAQQRADFEAAHVEAILRQVVGRLRVPA